MGEDAVTFETVEDVAALAGAIRDEIGKAVASLNQTTQTPITFTDEFGKQSTKIIETTTKMEGLETVMADLFGAKMGYKLIRFFKDFDGNMAQATNNVGTLGEAMDKNAGSIDNAFDALGRFSNLKRELAGGFLTETIERFPGGINAIFDGLDASKLAPKIQEIVTMIGRNLETVMQIGIGKLIGDVMSDLGKSFGEGVRSSIFGESGGKGGSSSFLPRLLGMGSNDTTKNTAPLIEDTNSILSDIRKNTLTSFFQ
jgi:hypothetical protein